MQVICDIYCRVSTSEQVEGYSIGEQEERLKQYAAAQGWLVHDVCTDGGFSGASLQRPAIQKVIADAQKGKINKVLVYKLDRISRSQKDTLYLIEEVFLKNHVDFVSMTETLDTSTPFGLAMIGILSVFAQLERETIRERMMMGRDARVKSGKFHGNANDCIGYEYRDGQLYQNEYDAAVVRRIFREYADGQSLTQIAKSLNLQQWRGHTWDARKVTRILNQPLYIGLQRWRGELYAVEQCPCIVTQELYEAVQKEMARRSGARPQIISHSALLGGMIWCGRCGRRYRAVRKSGSEGFRYYCYSNTLKKQGLEGSNCHNRGWGEAELDDIIIERIKGLRSSFADAAEAEAARSAEKDAELKAMEARLQAIEKQSEKLVELFALGAIDADVIVKRADALKAEKASIEASIEELSAPSGLLSHDDVMQKLNSFADLTAVGDTEGLKLIIHQLIKSITLTDDAVSIVWNFAD